MFLELAAECISDLFWITQQNVLYEFFLEVFPSIAEQSFACFCNVIECIYPSIEQRWLVQNV